MITISRVSDHKNSSNHFVCDIQYSEACNKSIGLHLKVITVHQSVDGPLIAKFLK